MNKFIIHLNFTLQKKKTREKEENWAETEKYEQASNKFSTIL